MQRAKRFRATDIVGKSVRLRLQKRKWVKGTVKSYDDGQYNLKFDNGVTKRHRIDMDEDGVMGTVDFRMRIRIRSDNGEAGQSDAEDAGESADEGTTEENVERELRALVAQQSDAGGGIFASQAVVQSEDKNEEEGWMTSGHA
jgi:small nuclear ribonucleoprotein (snRNP)-like protein